MALRDSPVARRFVSLARNSPWLMIAVGLHVILGVTLSVVYIRQHGLRRVSNGQVEIALAAHAPAPAQPVLPEPEPDIRQKIPDSDTPFELVSDAELEAFVPVEPAADVDWHERLGDPTATEDGGPPNGNSNMGVGKGAYRGANSPSGWYGHGRPEGKGGTPGRTTDTRTTPKGTQDAVLEGLRWLMRHQEADGSWSAATLHTHCSEHACIPADPTLDSTFDVGMTALALLAFLGQGIAPGAKVEIVDEAMGTPPRSAGEIVKRGVRWLMDQQKPDGSFSSAAPFTLPENDTLPTMALCEASALAPTNRGIRQQAQLALDFLVDAQRHAADGSPWGWGIGLERDLADLHARGELDDEAYAEARARMDPAITCWAVMALASARSCGFAVPDTALSGALAYARETEGADEAPLASIDPADPFDTHRARDAAVGMLIRTFAGGGIDDPFLEPAARAIAADVPQVSKDQRSVDFYYWYFAALALNQFDGPDSPRASKHRGEYWGPWNKGLVAALLKLQDRTRENDVCARGGWLQEARGNRRGRALYNTALNVLTLEVYYRFENVFGRKGK